MGITQCVGCDQNLDAVCQHILFYDCGPHGPCGHVCERCWSAASIAKRLEIYARLDMTEHDWPNLADAIWKGR